MMAIHSPSRTLKSIPFRTRARTSPVLNFFSSCLVSIIRSVPAEDRIECILPDYHPRRYIARNQGREYKEADTEKRLVERCDKNSVAERKIYGMRREHRDEYRIHQRKPDHRAQKRVKNRLKDV